MPTILEDFEIEGAELANTFFCVFNVAFYENNRDLYDAFMLALYEAVALLNARDDEAIDIVARRVGLCRETILTFMDLGYLQFFTDMSGIDLDPFINIAYQTGMISSMHAVEGLKFGDE